MQNYASIIAQELNIRPQQTEAVIRLLDEDATVPFIARYRKEATGSLDEVAVTAIRDRLAALKELDKRREAILASLEERGLLTPELRAKVETADALTVLEDIYLPYRPKRRTRASMAKERGLEPLADQLARQDRTLPEAMAAAYVDADLLCMDATYADDADLPKAELYGHATCRETGALAAAANVRRLWLTHYSAAVTDPAPGLAAARTAYPAAVAGYDGLTEELEFDREP